MTPFVLVLAAALLTYVSRAAALVLLPAPSAGVATVLRRAPAPLFAGLAVATLVGAGGSLPPVPTMVAVAIAVAVAFRRSLGLCLAAGLAGYVIAAIVTGW